MKRYRSLAIAIAILLALLVVFYASQGKEISHPFRQISYTELMDFARGGEIQKIFIQGENAFGNFKSGGSFQTTLLPYYGTDIIKLLSENGVEIDARPAQADAPLVTFLVYWLPFLAVIGVCLYLLDKTKRGFSIVDARLSTMTPSPPVTATSRTGDVAVRFKRLPHGSGIPLPAYQSAAAAGLDLHAADAVKLEPGEQSVIPIGFAIALPHGYEAQVRPRSGFAASHGVTVLNAPGTIDADYRGEIKVILINLGRKPVHIERGDRIAQMVVAPVSRVTVSEVEELDETARGPSGFGSSGTR